MKSANYFFVIVLAAFFSTAHCIGQDTAAATAKHASRTVNGQIDALDVLTDTQGVDFGPYMSGIIYSISEKWVNSAPDVALAPQSKESKVIVAFSVSRTGSVDDPKIVATSGDESLDSACAKAIRGATPFGPLPVGFKGQNLRLRIHFHYNRQKTIPTNQAQHP